MKDVARAAIGKQPGDMVHVTITEREERKFPLGFFCTDTLPLEKNTADTIYRRFLTFL